MKIFFKCIKFIFLSLIFFKTPKCQVLENFKDYKLTNWLICNSTHWQIDTIKGLLYHNYDNDSDGYELISFIHYPLELDTSDTRWEFKIYYPVNSSTENKWYFLIGTNKILCKNNFLEDYKGYAFGLNLTGNDNSLKFWKINNNTKTIVKSFDLNWNLNNLKTKPVVFSLNKNKLGLWKIFVDTICNNNDTNKILIGTLSENSYNKLISAGFYYQYTKTRDRNFYIHYLKIDGKFNIDSSPPNLIKYAVIGNKINLIYNEPLNICNQPQLNILMKNYKNIEIENFLIKNNTIELHFKEILPDNFFMLIETKFITDLFNNLLEDTIFIEHYSAKPYDIIITEIMADPYPSVSLPECEYIEIFNRSKNILSLNNWVLEISDKKFILPDTVIEPNQYLIITSSKCSELLQCYGKIISIPNLSSINNTGCEIKLYNNNLRLICSSTFDINYYKDSFKKNGGWSLELIDKSQPCEGKVNWMASIDPSGGTPGKKNSVENSLILENYLPEICRVFIYNDSILWLFANKIISKIDTTTKKYYVKNFGSPYKVNIYNEISNIIELKFRNKFESNKTYSIVINTYFEDCIEQKSIYPIEVDFQKSQIPIYNDIIFSEILYSPYEGGEEFFEIYNNSSKTFDLRDCFIGITNNQNKIVYYKPINSPFILKPGEYLAFTKDLEKIKKFYNYSKCNIIETNNIPALPDEGRCLFLYNKDTLEIDRFCFNNKSYPEIIKITRGLSLERNINCTERKNIWSSASFITGATPGLKNSQDCNNNDINTIVDRIELDKEVFSPDGDGIDDEITFKLIFANPENICNVYIFNASGKLVAKIFNNQLLGIYNEIKWNGNTIYGTKANIGIYIIFVEYYNLKGEVKHLKKSFYLAKKIG